MAKYEKHWCGGEVLSFCSKILNREGDIGCIKCNVTIVMSGIITRPFKLENIQDWMPNPGTQPQGPICPLYLSPRNSTRNIYQWPRKSWNKLPTRWSRGIWTNFCLRGMYLIILYPKTTLYDHDITKPTWKVPIKFYCQPKSTDMMQFHILK